MHTAPPPHPPHPCHTRMAIYLFARRCKCAYKSALCLFTAAIPTKCMPFERATSEHSEMWQELNATAAADAWFAVCVLPTVPGGYKNPSKESSTNLCHTKYLYIIYLFYLLCARRESEGLQGEKWVAWVTRVCASSAAISLAVHDAATTRRFRRRRSLYKNYDAAQ